MNKVCTKCKHLVAHHTKHSGCTFYVAQFGAECGCVRFGEECLVKSRTERRIRGANSRSAALPPKDLAQCCETLTVPMYSRTSPCVSLAVCVLKKGHEGKHKTSDTYGNKEWTLAARLSAPSNCSRPSPTRNPLASTSAKQAITSPQTLLPLQRRCRSSIHTVSTTYTGLPKQICTVTAESNVREWDAQGSKKAHTEHMYGVSC